MFEAASRWIQTGELASVRESLKNRSLNPEEKDEVIICICNLCEVIELIDGYFHCWCLL